jgi:hypothetical protein
LFETGFRKHQFLWLRQVKTSHVLTKKAAVSDRWWQHLSELTVGEWLPEAPNLLNELAKNFTT